MQRYIAFLSGLPVGQDLVEAPRLHSLFSRLGYLEVETFLTTGNVAFLTAPVGIIQPLEAQISRFLTKEIRDDVDVFIRTPDELRQIAEYEPFTEEDAAPGMVFIVLLHARVADEVGKRLERIAGAGDRFHVRGREIYWRRASRGSQSAAPPVRLALILERPATVRSLNTMKRLVTKYDRTSTGSVRSRR